MVVGALAHAILKNRQQGANPGGNNGGGVDFNAHPAVANAADDVLASLAPLAINASAFASGAVWMDHLKSAGMQSLSHWHYVDMPLQPLCATQLATCEPLDVNELDHFNALWALKEATHALKNHHADAFVHTFNLRVLLHIVGDIHQPLHTVSRYSKVLPHGDRGGNSVHVENDDVEATFQSARLVGGKKPAPQVARPARNNLHGVWDSAVGALSDVVYSTYPPACPTCIGVNLDDITRYADELLAGFPTPAAALGDVSTQHDDFEAWADEANAIAENVAYRDATHPERELEGLDDSHHTVRLDEAYVAKGASICERQMAKAGWRLALLLEDIYDARAPPTVATLQQADCALTATTTSATKMPSVGGGDGTGGASGGGGGACDRGKCIQVCEEYDAEKKAAQAAADSAGSFSHYVDYTDESSKSTSKSSSKSSKTLNVMVIIIVAIACFVAGFAIAVYGTLAAAKSGYLHAYVPQTGFAHLASVETDEL